MNVSPKRPHKLLILATSLSITILGLKTYEKNRPLHLLCVGVLYPLFTLDRKYHKKKTTIIERVSHHESVEIAVLLLWVHWQLGWCRRAWHLNPLKIDGIAYLRVFERATKILCLVGIKIPIPKHWPNKSKFLKISRYFDMQTLTMRTPNVTKTGMAQYNPRS